jgi:type VI secretion system secreted protein Hcp
LQDSHHITGQVGWVSVLRKIAFSLCPLKAAHAGRSRPIPYRALDQENANEESLGDAMLRLMKSKMKHHLIFLLVLNFVANSQCAGPAFDAFLKLDGVEEGSTDVQHPKEIVVLSFNQGVSRPPAGDAGSNKQGKILATFHNEAARQSRHRFFTENAPLAPTLSLRSSLRKSGAGGTMVEFYRATLSDLLIRSVHTAGSSGDSTLPVETLALSFPKIEWRYTPFDATGQPATPVIQTWDVRANTP